jgi:hypothetical protein
MNQENLTAGRDAMAGESLVSATCSPIARCDQCERYAVPGQFFCTEHLTTLTAPR